MLNELEASLVKAGYVRNPNESCFGLPGTGWYAGYAGLPAVHFVHEIRVVGDRFAVMHHYDASKPALFYDASKPALFYDASKPALFECGTVDELWTWCRENGKLSEPGLPAYSNSWD